MKAGLGVSTVLYNVPAVPHWTTLLMLGHICFRLLPCKFPLGELTLDTELLLYACPSQVKPQQKKTGRGCRMPLLCWNFKETGHKVLHGTQAKPYTLLKFRRLTPGNPMTLAFIGSLMLISKDRSLGIVSEMCEYMWIPEIQFSSQCKYRKRVLPPTD